MKKITLAATTGGAPIYIDDFKDVFNDEIWDAMQAILSPFDSDTQGVIVSGCAITGAGPYSIADGIVYLDGEFRRFTAQAGVTLPQYIKAATDVNTSRTFEDTTSKTLFVTKSADLQSTVPGSGQYIAITTSTDPDDRRFSELSEFTKTTVQAPDNTQFYIKKVDIGVWNMDTTTSVTVAHGVASGSIKIISIFAKILRDDSVPHDLNYQGSGGIAWNSTNVTLVRTTGGSFDNTSFDDGAMNRGELTIIYTA